MNWLPKEQVGDHSSCVLWTRHVLGPPDSFPGCFAHGPLMSRERAGECHRTSNDQESVPSSLCHWPDTSPMALVARGSSAPLVSRQSEWGS